jgi:hypothetical protein
MDTWKKSVTRKWVSLQTIQNLAGRKDGVSEKPAKAANGVERGRSLAIAETQKNIGGAGTIPESPSMKKIKEFDVLLEEGRKDLLKNFPNDPEGWIHSRLADGLEHPKK